MSDDCSRILNFVGLFLSLVGVLILFRWGMPFRVRRGGACYYMLEQIDEKEIAVERRYTVIGYVGLALLVLGTLLQMAAALIGR